MRAQLQQATLLMAPRADKALDHANAYSYIPTFIIHPHIMHGRSEVKTKTTTTCSLIGGVPWIQFTGVINWELSKAPGTMIPHRLSRMTLMATARTIYTKGTCNFVDQRINEIHILYLCLLFICVL